MAMGFQTSWRWAGARSAQRKPSFPLYGNSMGDFSLEFETGPGVYGAQFVNWRRERGRPSGHHSDGAEPGTHNLAEPGRRHVPSPRDIHAQTGAHRTGGQRVGDPIPARHGHRGPDRRSTGRRGGRRGIESEHQGDHEFR
jgi:hypothetical protein